LLIDAATHGATVTVTVELSAAGAHCPVTRTQYVVVVVGETLICELVPPETGFEVLPLAPVYH
jgi:hypothetical protein